jgi:hypothetical protein
MAKYSTSCSSNSAFIFILNIFKKRHSSNPPRRESANVRQSGVDRMPLALRGLIIEKLMEIEEIKGKKSDVSLFI